MKKWMKSLTAWKLIAGVIIAAGLYATAVRFLRGLGATTHLSDQFPWGLWIGFDILCGVGLAAGGFTLAATVHIFHIERFKPILRPAILTAFLGYVLVIVALMYDLGRPLQIWHALIMWNPHSVMFEIAWCVMLYTTVLALEFSPVLLEKFHLVRIQRLMKKVTIPLIILGVLLSTLHQSSLGSLYLIVPEKLYPLWYTPYLPVFFFLSAVGAGCAMTIFESCMSSRAFRRGLELDLLSDLGRVALVVLTVVLTLKIADLSNRSALPLLFVARPETTFYWLEIGLGLVAPIMLLALPKIRGSRSGLFVSSVLIILGFVLNRLNISVTGMEAAAGVSYFPSWMEIAVTMMIVSIGFIVFTLAAKHLPVFISHAPVDRQTAFPEHIEDLRMIPFPEGKA